MQKIADVIQRNIILRGADAFTIGGYTQVPNVILDHKDLAPGAKLVYAMLLKYAWNNGFCFPGQERLAADMGVTDRSVRTHLQELQEKGYVRIKRQGQGRPNLYELDMTVLNGRVTKAPPRARLSTARRASGSDRKKLPV